MKIKNIYFQLFILLVIFSCKKEINNPAFELSQVPEENYFIDKHGMPDAFFFIHKFNVIQQIKEQMYVLRNPDVVIEGEWLVQGPGNIGARINSIAVNPSDSNHILLGFSHGGIYLTQNGGKTWLPVFDQEVSLAIGDLAFDPVNTNIVYVGTGDANGGFYTGQGNGIYKSIDGGRTWEHKGLEQTRIIGEILVDHKQPNIVYAAAIGYSYARSENRGLYQSKDGGNSWKKILYISDSTAVSDIEIDPVNSAIVYAASFDKLGTNVKGIVQGLGNGIFKSVNRGETWTKLKRGLPDTVNGRIAIAVAPSSPNILYARYIGPNSSCGEGQHFNGLYKSIDYGTNWTRIMTSGLDCNTMGGFGWYFSRLFVNPGDPNDLFITAVRLHRSRDGGQTWSRIDRALNGVSVHADKHDIVFLDTSRFLLATDGGLYQYISNTVWLDRENIATTQFYRVAFNPNVPAQYFGGTQDNGSTGGNAAMIDSWPRIWGGDGFQMAFHPTNPDIFFAESQFGEIRMTKNRGFNFIDIVNNLPGSKNWDFPYQLSLHNPGKLMAGSDAIYVQYYNDTNYVWKKISPTMTTNGRYVNRSEANLTSIDESRIDSNIIIAGTNNGNLWMTDGYDKFWVNISTGLPVGYISSVKTSPNFKNTIYVTISAHRSDDFKPKVFRSRNMGQSYEDISGDLPPLPVFDILVYPERKDSVIFIANEIGVYATVDAGLHWERVGDKMPFIQVYDLEFNPVTKEIIAGTYARGIQTFPLEKILNRKVSTKAFDNVSMAEIFVYPNPAADFVAIVLENGKQFEQGSQIRILNIQGKVVEQLIAKSGPLQIIDFHALPHGNYFIEYFNGKSKGIAKVMKL